MENQKIGNYQITGFIASGASGYVYRAEKDNNKYAIKVCMGDFDDECPKRFIREIEIAQSINDPRIIHIYDSDMSCPKPYFVMELCDGSIQNTDFITSLDNNQRIDLALEICYGIKTLHDNNILHRDIKPSNILKKGNKILISDFSFGRFLNHNSVTLTSSNQPIGTIGYIAPEIYKEGGHQATISSDIYSLGCTIYYIFSGMQAQYYNRSGLNPNIARIIEKCRNNNPDERYANVQEIIDEFLVYQMPIQYISISDLLSHQQELGMPEVRLKALYFLLKEKKWDKLITDIVILGSELRKDIIKNIPGADDKILLLLENIALGDQTTWRNFEDIDPFTDFCAEIFNITNNIFAKQKALELTISLAVPNSRWPSMRCIKNEMLEHLNDAEIRNLSYFLKSQKELLRTLEDEINEKLPNPIRLVADL